jgi:hypothetical protein
VTNFRGKNYLSSCESVYILYINCLVCASVEKTWINDLEEVKSVEKC